MKWLGAALMLVGSRRLRRGAGRLRRLLAPGHRPREGRCALVTTGIFAWSRNPIYLALDLLVLGSFAIQGRTLFGLLAVLMAGLLHALILREERFLEAHYGDAYRSYRSRVPRYLKPSKGTKKGD